LITESDDAWEEIQTFVAALPEDARKHSEATREIAATGDWCGTGRRKVIAQIAF
jgi:hypothetical protein